MVGILDIVGVLNPIIDRVFPDPKDKLELQEKLATLADQELARQHDEVMGQIQTNTAEAGNANLFVAGWRPAVGWVCAVGVGYSFVLEPFMEFIAKLAHYTGQFPALDMGNLMTLMMGMLGMGYLRTKEKLAAFRTVSLTLVR
jgi:hypothetical protein